MCKNGQTDLFLPKGARYLTNDEVDEYLDRGFPKTRGDCVNGPRPCPWLRCRHHLAVGGSRKRPMLTRAAAQVGPLNLPETCALDCVDKGIQTLEDIGAAMGCTRERVRQLDASGIESLRDSQERWMMAFRQGDGVSRGHKPDSEAYVQQDWTNAGLGEKSDKLIALEMGLEVHQVIGARNHKRILAATPNWTPEEDQQNRELLGICLKIFGRSKLVLELGSHPRQLHGWHEGRRPMPDWARLKIEQLLKSVDVEEYLTEGVA